MSRAVRVAVAVVVVALGVVVPAAASPIVPVGSFSLTLDDSDPNGPYLDLVNETDGAFFDYFGYAAELTAGLYLCTEIDIASCEFGTLHESRTTGPGGVLFTSLFPTNADGEPTTTFIRVVVSIASLLPGATLDNPLIYATEAGPANGVVSFTCSDESVAPCTQFISYSPSQNDTVVPEPATLALLATGLGALLARRRRRL